MASVDINEDDVMDVLVVDKTYDNKDYKTHYELTRAGKLLARLIFEYIRELDRGA